MYKNIYKFTKKYLCNEGGGTQISDICYICQEPVENIVDVDCQEPDDDLEWFNYIKENHLKLN